MPKRCASKRALVVVAALLPVSIGVGSCGHAAPRRGTDREPTAGRHADGNLLLRLRDHGSTNTPAWILAVGTDGSGVLTHDRRDDVNGDRTFKAGTFDVRAIEALLARLDMAHLPGCSPAESFAPVEVGIGSVSFGSSASLDYRGRSISIFCRDSRLEVRISEVLARIVTRAKP